MKIKTPDSITAKPFLKWAGGKTQLLSNIVKVLPKDVCGNEFVYIEPFIGGGAFLFWMLANFSNLQKAVINDVNGDLINTYRTIASKPEKLISILEILENEYNGLDGQDEAKKEYYYSKRDLYNKREEEQSSQAALFIFLNKTCFNGLHRVNRKNEYNVPMGGYKKPTICARENIFAVSRALQKVEILCGDYEETLKYVGNNTLFYFDPPYTPLSETSNFNAYSKDVFNDAEQIRLSGFCRKLDRLNHSWILSNSDVKNTDENNNFFDDLYFGFNIQRVDAIRCINVNPKKRGRLKELLITNQATSQEYLNLPIPEGRGFPMASPQPAPPLPSPSVDYPGSSGTRNCVQI